MRAEQPKRRLATRYFAKIVVLAIIGLLVWLVISLSGAGRLFFGWPGQVALIWLPLAGIALLLMSQSVSRRTKFRFVGVLLGLLIGGLVGETAARAYFRANPSFERMRRALADPEVPVDYFYRSIGQPYLLYAPAPNLQIGANYHNEQGYRGQAVPLERSPDTVRVLCLGGSTTYGVGVENPNDAYPAQLEAVLNERRPASVRQVEVINAGLVDGTTAELLTHYHFKYQYYQPDLVVVNTGGNDAITAETSIFYQPDYSHERCQPMRPTPLAPECRALLHSRLFSFALIWLTYGSSQGSTNHIDYDRIDRDQPPPVAWHPAAQQPEQIGSLPDDQLGFTRNLQRLVEMIVDDGARVVLVPFRIAPSGEQQESVDQCARNERIMHEIAAVKQVPLAPFPASTIGKSNWVDSCHVNAAGCREKARHIAEFVEDALWPDGPSRETGN